VTQITLAGGGSCLACKNRCSIASPSEGLRTFELMFETSKRLSTRLADAIDLVIDFSTLGEYGLEPVAERPAPDCGARRRGSWSESGIRFAAIDRGDHLPARL
jgi:hypothetical protein